MRTFFLVAFAILSLVLAPLSLGADFGKGQSAYNSADYETAIAEWRQLAEDGHVKAQFGMGQLYSNGFGVAMNDAEALQWFSLAAEQGHADAMQSIAVMHANGWGVPQSDAEAFKWYGLAAENGVTAAQVAVARMLTDGYWEVQDNVRAYKWLNVAVELGDGSAAGKRDDLAGKMTADQISEANATTEVWMERYRVQLANH
jgi:TPR repeat protein